MFEFGSGITALVGPNGSGKSNIVDALRWVFGEQNPRLLRGARWEEVIFAGSASRRPVGLAEVSVLLDNADGDLPVPYREVEVSRRLLRSGDTEYAINRVPCRLRDIHELIAGTGAGGAAYAYVPQAAVDEILKSRPEDRRGVIEEAAGLARYRGRQQEAERRLAEVDSSRQRLRDLLADIQGQLEPLANEAGAAERYLLLRSEHEDIVARLWAEGMFRANRRLETVTERVASLRSNLAELEQATATLQGEIDAGRGALNQLRRVRAEADNLSRTFLTEENRRRAAVAVLEERLNHAGREQQNWSGRAAELRLQLDQCQSELQAQASAAAGSSSDGGDADNVPGPAAALDEALQSAEHSLSALQQARTAAANQEAATRSLLTTLQSERARRDEAVRGNTGRLDQLRRRISGLERTAAETAAMADKAGNQRDAASRQAEDLTHQLAVTRERLEAMDEQLRRSAMALAAAREAVSVVVGERTVVKERWLAAEAAQGRVPLAAAARDLTGRMGGADGLAQTPKLLASLLQVQPGADKAVAAALGLAQFALVTPGWADVHKILKFRQANSLLGTLVLIPGGDRAGAGRGGRDPVGDQMSSYLPLAGAVTSRDPSILPSEVLSDLLGRFVLVDSMQAALEVGAAGNGLAAVTREGQAVLPGGVVVDGPGAFEQDLIGLPALQEELARRLEELEQSLTKARAAESDATREQARLADQRRQLAAAATDLSARLASATTTQQRASEQAAAASGRLDAVQRELDLAGQDAAGLADTLKDLNASAASAAASSEEATTEYEQVRQESARSDAALAAGRDSVHNLRLRKAQIEEQRAAQDERIARLTAQQQTLAKELAEASGRARESRLSFDRLQGEIREARSGLASCHGQREEAEVRSRSLTREVVAQEHSVQGREAELAKTTRAHAGASDKLHQAELSLERLGGDLRSLEVERRGLAPRFADLQPAATSDAVLLRSRRDEVEAELAGIGPVNLGAAEQVRRLTQRLAFLTEQEGDLESSELSLRTSALELEREIQARFLRCFEETRVQFAAVFSDLFGGGQADLELTDPERPLVSGIEVLAQPPGKRMSSLALLSGGERALTAIALLFSLLGRDKTGFSVLDEVDAHLDEPNCLRFRRYLRSLAGRQQFLVVTHSKATMEAADVMYGLTMEEDGVSRCISVRLEQAGGAAGGSGGGGEAY